MKVIERKTNSKGIDYALVTFGSSFGVTKQCVNYDGKVRGGLRKTWCVVVPPGKQYPDYKMTLDEAKTLFARRTK